MKRGVCSPSTILPKKQGKDGQKAKDDAGEEVERFRGKSLFRMMRKADCAIGNGGADKEKKETDNSNLNLWVCG